MDIKQRGLWLARQIPRVLWFIVRNPFLILKRLVRWSLVLLFWLFLLGWGISVFAVESTPAKSTIDYKATCTVSQGGPSLPNSNIADCKAFAINYFSTVYSPVASPWVITATVDYSTYIQFKICNKYAECHYFANLGKNSPITTYICPPDGKPDFTAGPVVLNGANVCQKQSITCKMGEVKTVSQSTGVETCQENCKSVAGQVMTGAAYNQAFLPSATVTCYGSCSVISQGTTVELPADGFTQHGDIQFTGDKCPVKFPETGTGQPVYNDQPASSQQTNNAQNQLQNAASGATSNQVSGATGTADLNAVVNKLAETSNAQIKAMSEQNAAMGKVIEGVGKDIQGAIREGNANNGGGGAGNSVGQMQTANAIKEGNQTLKEIKDKLDEQQNPEPPVSPGTNLDADAKSIHEANDWSQRNFGTVLTANATRFRALPIFALPTTFFTVNLGGAACPTYTGSFTVMGSTQTVTLDAFCSSTVMNVMPFIRAVVMMVFGWLAWRIAIGNGG